MLFEYDLLLSYFDFWLKFEVIFSTVAGFEPRLSDKFAIYAMYVKLNMNKTLMLVHP